MVIRDMALHDILFLAENEGWFQAYNVQYGHRFNEPDKIESYNKHLIEYYLKAKEKLAPLSLPAHRPHHHAGFVTFSLAVSEV